MTSFDVNPSILGRGERGTATSEPILKRLQNLGTCAPSVQIE